MQGTSVVPGHSDGIHILGRQLASAHYRHWAPLKLVAKRESGLLNEEVRKFQEVDVSLVLSKVSRTIITNSGLGISHSKGKVCWTLATSFKNSLTKFANICAKKAQIFKMLQEQRVTWSNALELLHSLLSFQDSYPIQSKWFLFCILFLTSFLVLLQNKFCSFQFKSQRFQDRGLKVSCLICQMNIWSFTFS